LVSEGAPLVRPIFHAEPLHFFADDHGGNADLKLPGYFLQIRICKNNAAIARARVSAVSIRRRSMQPDSVAIPAFDAIPFVRVVDRESPGSVEIRKLLPGQAGGDVVDA